MNKQQNEKIIDDQNFHVINIRYYADEIVKYIDNHYNPYISINLDKINYLKRLAERILNNLNAI